MRRVATNSRSALPRPAHSALARRSTAARLGTSHSGTSNPAPSSHAAAQLRSLATLASPHKVINDGSSGSSSVSPRKPLFSKVLIANRGEIAVRIIRTCRRLGIKTVAVFSEADRHSMHVKMADEAYLLGPAPSHLSYLNIPRLLEVCHLSGAQAVHPGYGFMSENADFARQLEREGIVFIGPGVEAIVSMGSKAESKDIMKAANVPCIPGWHPSTTGNAPIDPSIDTQSADFLILEADKIGYPVLIKAVSGGGGKGMKIVDKREDFASQLESAKREGKKSFGDDTVLLEKYVTKPRHVEVQIFSDSHGNHLSLFERDCSVQRRHQKVIEEAPAPNLSQEVRDQLYETARKAARAVGYRGAGTVEFVLNADKPEEFFFLEVNTRLQVEHPVTEAITGVDLVEWQLEVAAGNPIPLRQEEITCTGHAFEVRVYAENPRNNFLPDTGTLLHVKTPKESEYVRLETGFEAGDEISVFYDPLIAKLIVHGPNRREALKRLRKALGEYQIVGPSTNLEFLTRLAENEAFGDEDLDTGFIPRHHDSLFPPLPSPSPSTLASSALYLANREISHFSNLNPSSPWSSPRFAGFRLSDADGNKYKRTYETGQGNLSVSVSSEVQGGFDVTFASQSGETTTLSTDSPTITSSTGTSTSVSTLLASQLARVDIVSSTPSVTKSLETGFAENLNVFNEAESFAGTIEVKQPSWMKNVGSKRGGGVVGGGARAPMPSKIVEVKVKAGDRVEAGDSLVVVEAMKMEHVLKASQAGIVEKVTAQEGDLVKEGQILITRVRSKGERAKIQTTSLLAPHSFIRIVEALLSAAIRPFYARSRPLGLVQGHSTTFLPRLLQLELPITTRLYSTDKKVETFLKRNESKDSYYPWTGLLAFKAAHSQEQIDKTPTLQNLDIPSIQLLPIKNRRKGLPIYFEPHADRTVQGQFLLSHEQVVRLEDSMFTSKARIPRAEVEQAWEKAACQVVRESELDGGGKIERVLLNSKEIAAFIEEESRKPQEKPKEEVKSKSKKTRWKPRPFEGELWDSLVSWSNIKSLCEKRDKPDPRWFLRQLMRETGPLNDLLVVKASPTRHDKNLGDSKPVYLSWPIVQAIFVRHGWKPPRGPVEGLAVVPSKQKSNAQRYAAYGLDELEQTLKYCGHPLEPSLPPSLESTKSDSATREEVHLEREYASWSEICAVLQRPSKSEPPTPRRTPGVLLQYLLDISDENSLTCVQVVDSTSSDPSRDIYLPHSVVQDTLRQLGALAGEFDSKKRKAELGISLSSYTLDQLESRQVVKIGSVHQLESRIRSCREADRSEKAQAEIQKSKPKEISTSKGKGTKRDVIAIERTKGQLLTPAPSVESTPEPVPPPLKRAKSSQIVPTVATLSIASSTPSTPIPSPVLATSAPSALLPSDSTTVSASSTIVDAKIAASKNFELETLRLAYETAQSEGGASFLALDVEFWERDHEVLTEFGWSVVEFVRHQNGKVTERREDQHAVIKENQRFRNGRFSPDARDHFDFGRTLALPAKALYYLLHALFSTLSTTHPLFLVFHDPRGDLRALSKLGFDTQKEFEQDFMQFGKKKNREGGGIWIVDTQRIFSAWLGRKSQIGLEKACTEVEVPTKRLHNAGNDAHYTLALLERLMDRSRRAAADSPLIKMLDERAAAAKRAKLASAAKKEREEQAALVRK